MAIAGRRRVVITGLGAITPFGFDVKALWEGASTGKLVIRPMKNIDVSEYSIKCSGELPDESWLDRLNPNVARKVCRTTAMGLHAAGEALSDAGYKTGNGPIKMGVYLGSGVGPAYAAAEGYSGYYTKGIRGIRPLLITRSMFNNGSSTVSIHYKLTGGNFVLAAACSSATVAMGQAFLNIAYGMEDAILTGGIDSPLEPAVFTAWNNMKVVSAQKDPAKCCRPFDKERDGLVLSEGSCMLVFEELGRAKARGAKILAEIAGFGFNSDAAHITQPDPEGQAEAIRRALSDAGVAPEQVDYINAHGTSTLQNDRAESSAIKKVFGPRRVSVSSTKSMHGHMMGASGAVESVITVMAVRNGLIPPTINLFNQDPECDIDATPNAPVRKPVRVALKNSFAFGGANAVLVFKKYTEDA